MNAVGGGGQGDVGAGVDEESSSQFPVLSSQFEDDAHGFTGQRFQFAGREVFFAELDVVDTVTCGFGDFVEETLAAGGLVAGEGATVGNVVEQAAISHQLFRYQFKAEKVTAEGCAKPKFFNTGDTGVHRVERGQGSALLPRLGSGFGDFGEDFLFFFFPGGAAQVVLG